MTQSSLEEKGGETIWCNHLGSELRLVADGKGNLAGTYLTTVGDASSAKDPMPLCGKYNPGEEFPSLGWAVQWKGDDDSTKPRDDCDTRKGHTTVAWSGQLLVIDKAPTIKATWVLTKQTSLRDSWKAATIGHDEFSLKTTP